MKPAPWPPAADEDGRSVDAEVKRAPPDVDSFLDCSFVVERTTRLPTRQWPPQMPGLKLCRSKLLAYQLSLVLLASVDDR